ncbi:MAG: nitroreductase family deazaflavin-dependent oxidoreductase [Gammaproteobacteria bacterium]|nr:MAG: nitroreductase family deazaflavin-dependent oxidoreductase [Gammaproteobacteria bacterium]
MSNAETEDLGRPPPRWLLKALTRLNVFVYRASGGRLMNKLGGDPICLVNMTGAKTSQPRTIPLMYVPDGDSILLVASQGGAPTHPVWYHNLVAYPDVVVEEGGRQLELRARLVDAEEKARLWPICVAHYQPYEDYQRRTDRDIPVFRCEPR